MSCESDKHRFTAVYENQHFDDVRGRGFVRALFKNCTFKKLKNSHFVNCTMEGSAFEPDDIRDIVGITLTLNCHTFKRLKFSQTTLDGYLYLASMAAPDEQSRQRVRAAITPHNLKLYDRVFPSLE